MESKKLVALTFDDGPSNITEQVLDILEANQIAGTFFLIGNLVTPEYQQTLKRQLALGCEIANHSFTHQDMSTMTPEVIKDEIDKTSAVIREMAGVETHFFRPPYIALSDTMYDTIPLPFICGIDSRDWDPTTNALDRINNVCNGVTDGALVLMHDLENNLETVKALPTIIERLRADGYSFVTASQIFEQKHIDPKVYHRLWSNVFQTE